MSLHKDAPAILNAVVEWAIYILDNNIEKIYLSDIVKITKKDRSLWDALTDLGGGNANNINRLTIKDGRGNSLELGYFPDYLQKSEFSDNSVIGVEMRGQLGNSNRYDIHFVSRRLSGNGTQPSIFFLNFNGEPFYERIKNRILNPNQPTTNTNIDGNQSGNFNIKPVDRNK